MLQQEKHLSCALSIYTEYLDPKAVAQLHVVGDAESALATTPGSRNDWNVTLQDVNRP